MIIGITGTIGAGKSTVSNLIHKLGYQVIDADKINHELMARGEPLYEEIIGYFGNEILDDDKNIDRSILRNIVFDNDEARVELEAMSHRVILERMQSLSNIEIVFWEVPLLFESHWEKYVDKTILVTTSYEETIKRVMKRNNLSKEEVENIIAKQMPVSEKEKLADYIVNNDSNMIELEEKIKVLLKSILND